MDYDELRNLNNDIYTQNKIETERKTKISDSVDRTLGICEQSQFILNDIEENFLKKTKLSKHEIPFLFLSVALQTLRWILLPCLNIDFSKISKEERLQSNEVRQSGLLKGKKSGQRFEKPAINRYKESHYEKYISEESEYRRKLKGCGGYQYKSWIEILFHAVPYDAFKGSEQIQISSKNIFGRNTFLSPKGKQLNGRNHHVATLGHDPVMGWIFGTMNIASSMITFCDLQTFPVHQEIQLDKWQQSIDYLHPSSVTQMIYYCINSFHEDFKRLPAAVARQAMHMQSDKYTKDGLQIPLLSPDKAQKLIDIGWNSNEMERVLKKIFQNTGIISMQLFVSEIINTIIRSIYLFLNSNEEFTFSKVKIERILSISGIIAECSNVAVVAATRDVSRLDIGGLIGMVHQIAADLKTRSELEIEYLITEFDKVLMEDI